MNIEIIIYGSFSIVLIIILIVYLIYVILEEREKLRYYKHNILYVTDWDKYNTMVKRQRRIIIKKKFQLLFLTFLVKLKRVVKWN